MKNILLSASISMGFIFIPHSYASINAENVMDKVVMCSKHEKAAIRLFCYEDIADNIVEDKKNKLPDKDIGEWKINNYVGSDDNQVFSASLKAKEERYAPYKSLPELEISCSEGVLDLYIHWDQYLSSESPVLSNLDDDEPDKKKWIRSKNSLSSIYPDESNDLVSSMMDAETFTAMITPYNSKTITANFDLDFMDNALIDIKDHCDL